MERVKEFITENRFVFIVCILLLLLICWLHTDKHRNDGIHHDTDTTVDQLEKRIQSVESRLGTMQDRIEQNQKTIESVGRRISTSTGLAIEIGESTDQAESRLDDAIQRSGRIENLISEIERTNK